MLEGLRSLNEGLIEYGLQYRSDKNGESVEQGIKRELSDMTRLLLEVDELDDSSKRLLTEGIVKYAMGFYLLVRRFGIFEKEKLVDAVSEYFKRMDDKFYSELEGTEDDMEELVKYLNSIDLKR